jgi:hypothetical protein
MEQGTSVGTIARNTAIAAVVASVVNVVIRIVAVALGWMAARSCWGLGRLSL